MDENKLMFEFLSGKLGTNDSNKIQKYLKGLDKELQLQLAQEYLQWKAKRKVKAAHGAKLSYIKSLKHICPEGEELVYFKKGGSVNCGCQKKETGGEVEKAEKGVIAKFKSRKMQSGGLLKLDPKTTKTLPNGKYPEYWTSKQRQEWERLHGDNDEGAATVSGIERKPKREEPFEPKNIKRKPEKGINRSTKGQAKTMAMCGGSKMKLVKKGDKVCPKCGKVHAAGVGCSIAKFKYRKLGGLL